MKYLLSSYRPLIQTWFGRQAVLQHNLPRFIDASCRREPDFENPFPSMTSICRGNMGAVRLSEGDFIAYMTVKDRFEPAAKNGRYLVGGFKVIKRFGTHKEAAKWYVSRGIPIPSNCFVEGNKPNNYIYTGGHAPSQTRRLQALTLDPINKQKVVFERLLSDWDKRYLEKVEANSTFIITEPIQRNYINPPLLSDELMHQIFGRIPLTRTPCNISPDQFWQLIKLLE